MEKQIKQHLEFAIRDIAETIREEILWAFKRYKIKSPIEQLFYIEWFRQVRCQHASSIQGEYWLEPQYEIKEKKKVLYRVDFIVLQAKDVCQHPTCQREDFPPYGKSINIVIELDSFAFHEKTKEQFEYEKKRDRYLHQKEWKVFRFSGSEITRNVSACVGEICEYLGDLECTEIDRLYEEYLKEKERGDAKSSD